MRWEEQLSSVRPEYSRPPFIQTSETELSIMAASWTKLEASGHQGVCIFADTYDTCRFKFGPKHTRQIDFDYEILGSQCATDHGWLAFWVNSALYDDAGVPSNDWRSELDLLETNGWTSWGSYMPVG